MNLMKKITLSDRFSCGLVYLSLAVFVYIFYRSLPCVPLQELALNLFVFLVSGLAIYPVIDSMWRDVQENWEKRVAGTGKSYLDFFTEDLDEETRTKIVRSHWKAVEWVVPYVFSAYLFVAGFMVYLFSFRGLVLSLFGSLFMTGLVSVKYQRELKE
ncbi:MAG: hypothetical protein ACLFS3_03140 [Candidatus Aenigmatarchaeota archaeon]